MGRKQNQPEEPNKGADGTNFDDVEDSFFASGDASSFWEKGEEDKLEEAKTVVEEAPSAPEEPESLSALPPDEDSVEFNASAPPPIPQPASEEEDASVAEYNPYTIHPDPGALSDQETEVLSLEEAQQLGVFDEETAVLPEADALAAFENAAGISIAEAKTEPGVVAPKVPPPPAVPELQTLAYTPTEEDAAAWREAATTLEREASASNSTKTKAKLLANAAQILLTRVGDEEAAATLFDAAFEAGLALKDAPRAYADVVANRGEFEKLRDLLLARAEGSKGMAAAESLQDAALVERNNLKRDDKAVLLLERCLAIQDDWFTLRLLRELHYRSENWAALIVTLGRMADLASDVHAARMYVEQGRLQESQLNDPEAAATAYLAALSADPSNMEAFLAAGRLAGTRGDWNQLVGLYETEAMRLSDPDTAFWLGRAARVARDAQLNVERVVELYENAVAVAEDDRTLRHEQQAYLRQCERFPELGASFAAEAKAGQGMERALALYRLGQLQESQLNDVTAALQSYRDAVEADPGSAPASESVSRLLAAAGDNQGLVAFLGQRYDAVAEPSVKVAIGLRIGEIAERSLNDLEMAAEHYERCLETIPGYVPALDALERVCGRTESWQRLVEVCTLRAGRSGDPDEMAHRLYRAGTVCETHLDDSKRAADLFQQALQRAPDHHGALEAATRALAKNEQWGDVAETLRAAASNTRSADSAVQYHYRAARILDDRCEDVDGAVNCLQRCLDLQPSFLPAVDFLRELSARKGNWQSVYDLRRLQAGAVGRGRERHWHLLDAAEVTRHLDGLDAEAVALEILDVAPGHMGALTMLESAALLSGDKTRLLKVYGRFSRALGRGANTRIASRIADVAQDVNDDGATLRALGDLIERNKPEDAPLTSLARVAVSLGRWADGERALAAAGTGSPAVERARLLESHGEDRGAVADAWRDILASDPSNSEAASGLERSLSRLGERTGLASVHAQLADNLANQSIQAMHALLAGHLFESEDSQEEAVVYYLKAFSLRPVPGKAMDALIRIHAESGDVDGIEGVFKALNKRQPIALAQALELAGAHEQAVAVYDQQLKALPKKARVAEELPLVLALEHNLARIGDWARVCSCLARRAVLCTSEEERQTIEGKRRWILAEKLADTDEAWEFYRSLHEEKPEDADVLEALARIAGARGESNLAIQYLEGLSNIAATPNDASRYQRRVAEVHLAADDSEAAREAFLRALDHQPEDLDALEGLKSLARKNEDWPALVGVLSREVKVRSGEENIACHREIARLWEVELSDLPVAAEAWRQVLDLVPSDSDALEHLVGLSRQCANWTGFVEYGQALVHYLKGEAQAELLAELGHVTYQHLRREEDAVRYLDQASLADPPNVGAAELLESIHSKRGAWDLVVEALLRQARAVDSADAIALYLKAARTRRDALHDRRGAASIYDQVLRVAPNDVEALRFKGDFLFEFDELDRAVEMYTTLEGIDQNQDLDDFDVQMETALFFYRFGETLRRLGRTDEALARYKGALKLNQSHLPSLEAVGPLFIANEQWDEAARTFKQILQLTGGHGDAAKLSGVYTSLGLVEYQQGHEAKALKRFNKALELQPNQINALQGYGRILFDKMDWNSLLTVYNNIIYHAQEPGDVVDAYLIKGFVLDVKLSLPDKAAQHFEKSLAFDPAQPVALLRLAELALRREAWAEALSLADRAKALPASVSVSAVTASLELTRATALSGRGDEAMTQEAINAAAAIEDGLGDALQAVLSGSVMTTMGLHDLLRERLQAQL